MTNGNLDPAGSTPNIDQGRLDGVRDFMQGRWKQVAILGSVVALTAGVITMPEGNAVNEQQAGSPGTTELDGTTTALNESTTTQFTVGDGVVDGSDEAILADHNREIFECGPKEPGIDGNSTSYDPDTYISYMNENLELAEELDVFTSEDMGADAYSFLIEHSAVNPLADPNLVIEGVDDYSDLTHNLYITNDVPSQVALNFRCNGPDGDEITEYDLRQLTTEQTTVAGVVLRQADFEEWQNQVRAAGLDPDYFINFDFNKDMNNDDQISDDEKFKFVVLMHAVCKNPLRTHPEQPPETTTTTIPTPTTQPPPETTVPTIPTTTTTIDISKIPRPPVTGGPNTTVPAPEPQPIPVPTTANVPTTRPPVTAPPSSIPNIPTTSTPPTTQPQRP